LGVRHFTHFGNRMRGIHHREIGLVGAGLMQEDAFLELIGDGEHLSYDFVRMVLRQKPVCRLALVSDSIGMGALGGEELKKKGFHRDQSRLVNSEGVVAGGETLLLKQVKKLYQQGIEKDLQKLFQMITVNPLNFFGIPYGQDQKQDQDEGQDHSQIKTILSKDLDFLGFARL
jgi:N-acetylglucosamine-6-phosphate deacetylase